MPDPGTARPDDRAPNERTTPASIGRRLALSLGVLALSMLGAELVVRALGLEPARYAETRHLESDDKRVGLDLYPSDARDAFPLDLRDDAARRPLSDRIEELDGWAPRAPHAVRGDYTAELCRVAHEGDVLPAAARDRPRVVLLGDSFIEGQGVVFEHTVAARLGDALGDDHDVLACGRRGYDFAIDPSATRGLGRWMSAHVLDADVVVYAMTLNDPARSEAFARGQSYVDDWIVDRRRMLSHDATQESWLTPRLFTLVEDRIEAMRIGAATMRWYQQMVESPNREGWQATLAQLERFAERLRSEGRELVVALWPLLVGLESEDAYPFVATHARIALDLDALPLTVIDTLPAFLETDTRSLWVHEVDHHPNDEGHRRFAEAILPPVREALARARARRDSAHP